MARGSLSVAALLSTLSLAACGDGVGEPGTELPQPLVNLSGGVVFSTWVLDGADGYDLFWSPAVSGGEQAYLQLTSAGGDDTQPSIAPDGQSLVYAREGRGIMHVDASGAITAITDTRGTPFLDSLPALSAEGDRVAWVREDTSRPIGQSGFVATEVWVADFDGDNARPVNPKPNVVQDAPVFEPLARSTRLAWSELNAATLGASGPVDYGVWLHDLDTAGGRFACQGAYEDPEAGTVRCFGQHLSWPRSNALVLDQQLLVIDPETGPLGSLLPDLLRGMANVPGAPERSASPSGFFEPFPLSASFAGDRLVIDGVFNPFDGDQPTLAFFLTDADGSAPMRLQVTGHRGDIDPGSTAGYLFSLSTPQLVP